MVYYFCKNKNKSHTTQNKMERRSLYPIEIKCKVDLNTDLLLTELQTLLHKNRSQIIRLIIADFFDRKLDLIDQYKGESSNKEEIIEMILRDFYDLNRESINEYLRNKQTNTRHSD